MSCDATPVQTEGPAAAWTASTRHTIVIARFSVLQHFVVLSLLSYCERMLHAGILDVDVAENVIRGIVEGCNQSGCQLMGGETAEMPGFYEKGEYDLAGFATGAVKKVSAKHTTILISLKTLAKWSAMGFTP